jgi:hypothetical protein
MPTPREEAIKELHELTPEQWAAEPAEPVQCAGNQHTCLPEVRVAQTGQVYNLVLKGTGDSEIVGHSLGPRALVWKDTQLTGYHEDLGALRMTLEPGKPQAGTLIPVTDGEALPAINRNTYHFVFSVEKVGELVSDRPAIVEALLDEIPPRARYEFKNGPVAFHLRDDPAKTPIVYLDHATTDVAPTEAG